MLSRFLYADRSVRMDLRQLYIKLRSSTKDDYPHDVNLQKAAYSYVQYLLVDIASQVRRRSS